MGLQIDEQSDLFAEVAPVASSDLLNTTLQETVELAIAINTEKARSEMIIIPMLLEVRRRAKGQISLFSGVNFDSDKRIAEGVNTDPGNSNQVHTIKAWVSGGGYLTSAWNLKPNPRVRNYAANQSQSIH